MFFFKYHPENEVGRLVPKKIKKRFMRYNQVVSTFVSIHFDSPQTGHTIKRNCIKFQIVDLKYAQF